MTTTYLLPCSCGEKNLVNQRQAGEMVECRCGARLEVPTMRGLAQLDRAEGSDQGERVSAWGIPQGLAFLGVVIVAAGLLFSGYHYMTRPRFDPARSVEELQNASPADTWRFWEVYREGIPGGLPTATAMRRQQLQAKWRWIWAGGGIAAVGLFVVVSSFLITPPPRSAGQAD